jgi:hypothetical protein
MSSHESTYLLLFPEGSLYTGNVKGWDNYLGLAEFIYNSTVYTVTGVSPFEADLDYVSCLPVDFRLGLTQRDSVGAFDVMSFARLIELRL